MNGTRGRRTDEGRTSGGPNSTLSAALAGLDDGCCVLVTGDVPDDACRLAAARYFGATDRRRRRVLALTDGAADAAAWLPEDVDPADDDAAVVRLGDGLRDPTVAVDEASVDGASVAGTGSEGLDGPETTTGPETPGGEPSDGTATTGRGTADADAATDDGATAPDSVDLDGGSGAEAVRTAIMDAIDEVAADSHAGRLELRVGVYRVDALSATIGAEATRELLRDVAATTRARGGMAHLHLPRAAGVDGADDERRRDPVVDDLVEALGDELDVTAELRSREQSPVPEERWHILGWGCTEWNPLG